MSNKKYTVLVIEDNQDTLRLLNALAQEATDTIALITATTVAAAEELLERRLIDLVYMDGDLDTLGPYPVPQTMELLRKYAPKFTGRIFSSSSSEDYQEKMIAAGCMEAVLKTEIINHALERITALEKGYQLGEGKPVVLQLVGDLKVYLGRAIMVKDRTRVSISDSGALSQLPLSKCSILDYETHLIQSGGIAGFNHIIEHYRKYMNPICSMLTEFGAKDGICTQVQLQTTKNTPG